jgi:hypothetical protein
MEYEDKNTNRVVVRCRIEAKEASGEAIHGFYMCVAGAGNIEYDGALFSRELIDTEAPFSELYAMLEAPGPEEYRDELEKYGNALKDYVKTSRLFQSEKNLNDAKALEHKITYFFMSAMSLNVISFLELTPMSQSELYLTIPSLKRKEEPDIGEDQSEWAEEAENGEPRGFSPTDVAVSCDPVLDPVTGVPVSELSVGDTICCKLREDSVFFGLMLKASPDFNGTVSGDVTSVHVNEIGSAVVSLKLSDGVAGVLKLTGTVRIKTLSRKEMSETVEAKISFRPDVLLAIAGMAFFLFVMWLLLRLWG